MVLNHAVWSVLGSLGTVFIGYIQGGPLIINPICTYFTVIVPFEHPFDFGRFWTMFFFSPWFFEESSWIGNFFWVEAVQAALPKGVEVRCHFGNLDETEEELKSENKILKSDWLRMPTRYMGRYHIKHGKGIKCFQQSGWCQDVYFYHESLSTNLWHLVDMCGCGPMWSRP